MLIEFLTSKFFYVIPMLSGSLLFWLILRFVSLGTGVTMADARKGIRDGNVAIALYFAARILGVAITIGCCVLAGARF